MKRKDISAKTPAELEALVGETQVKLQDQRIELRTKQVTQVREVRNLRKTLARALTLLRAQQLAAAETEEGGTRG